MNESANFNEAMMKQEDIELQLWSYIDGTVTEAERERIAGLIATDGNWGELYGQLTAFHQEFKAMERNEPSMRFTRNVMEAVAATSVAPATRKYIDHRLLRGIAAVFVLAIVLCICLVLSSVDWHSGAKWHMDTAGLARINKVHVESLLSSNAFYLLACNLVAGLVLVDIVLRRKHKSA